MSAISCSAVEEGAHPPSGHSRSPTAFGLQVYSESITPPNEPVKSDATTLTPSIRELRLKMEQVKHNVEGSITPPAEPKKQHDSPTPPSDVKPAQKGPQLIGDLPRAEAEALRTFSQIPDNHYQYGTLGRSREALESMTCDCQYEHGVDDPIHACGHGSDCINRLTQVECMPDDCRCRSYCQNQRFQRKQYADLEIVLTEKKGFGLRAATDIRGDAFIYEYVGEVVSLISFKKRMRDYAAEGIQHFYFMMLQKDEFLDATKRGGIGRFANHSCNPNCYVARWTIGQHVRMGIFAHRNIKKNEELTFNYNVDRYGHDAQPCYCGEAKCVGFIGGKTQTDIGAMDDLYLDALGITDDVELLGLKGSKKKRSKKLDEDWTPTLKPMVEKDVPKVVQAIRQTQSRKVLLKLLTRVKLTEDHAALRQLMRLRGFSLMTNILDDHVKDLEIIALALECLATWPLLQRNKVDDSKIAVPVQAFASSDNEVIKTSAQKLLDYWDTLESGYRIPKRLKQDGSSEEDTKAAVIPTENDTNEARPSKRSRYSDLLSQPELDIKPLAYTNSSSNSVQHKAFKVIRQQSQVEAIPTSRQPSRQVIAQVIAAASAAVAADTAKPPAPTGADQDVKGSKHKSSSKSKRPQTKEEKEATKEKRLQKLVGAVVVKCLSKHSKQMDHDVFKKNAKELTCLIAEKEKKSSSYKEGKLDALSEEKVTKIKKFAKEYIAKVLRKLEKSGYRPKDSPSVPSTANASAASETPNSNDRTVMTVEEAMDMDEVSDDGDKSDHEEDKGEVADMSDVEELAARQTLEALPPEEEPDEALTRDPMDLLSSPNPHAECSDPRSRPPNGMHTIECSPSDEDRDEIDFLGAPSLDSDWGCGTGWGREATPSTSVAVASSSVTIFSSTP